MRTRCKGICETYKATKGLRGSYYDEGNKRCQICTMFLKVEGTFCPCCGFRLRSKPRSKKSKDRKSRLAGAPLKEFNKSPKIHHPDNVNIIQKGGV